MGRWVGRLVGARWMVLAVGLALGVEGGGSALAQTPEARPGQPGWTRTDRGCHVWHPAPSPGANASWNGACQNGRASGGGTMFWRYSSWTERYDGEMRDGKRHGRGTYVWANGNRYDGEWREGHGHGRATWVGSNGARYEGEYRDGKRHGRGTYVFENGDRYEGEYRDGVPDGLGAFYFADSGETYNGLWRQGCFRDGGRRVASGVPLSSCP